MTQIEKLKALLSEFNLQYDEEQCEVGEKGISIETMAGYVSVQNRKMDTVAYSPRSYGGGVAFCFDEDGEFLGATSANEG